MAVNTQLQVRRGTASQWTSSNPTLASGEFGFETDTGKFKIGNGSTAWSSLSYASLTSADIPELSQDAINDALTAGTGIVKSYNDAANTLTISVDTNTIATRSYADSAASTAAANLVASAPATLDTLNELAAALGNDANFSTTVTNSIATKAPIASPTFTGTVTIPTGASITTPNLTLSGTSSTTQGRIAWDQTNKQLDVGDGTVIRTITADDASATLTNKTISGANNTLTVRLANDVTGTLPVANGGTGITAFGTGVATALGVNVGSAGAPVVNGGALGTPSSGTLTNATGLPISTGVSGLASGAATFLATPTSANLAALLTDETGTGANVFANTPSIVSPVITGTSSVNQILEKVTVAATAATGTINYDLVTNGAVTYYTSNASGNWTLNVRGDSGTTLNSIMSTGQSVTIAFLVTNGATAFYQTALQVDGASVTPRWQGGTAPTSGNTSSIDGYTITLIKTGNAAFTAIASQTRFA